MDATSTTSTSFVGDNAVSGTSAPTQRNHPHRTRAYIAIVLGVVACVVPVPFLDVACGVVGIILAFTLSKEVGRLRLNAIILTILGTILAIIFTISWLDGGFSFFDFIF